MMFTGVALNLFYWSIGYFVLKQDIRREFLNDPLAHVLLLLSVPVMFIVGYLFAREKELTHKLRMSREKIEEVLTELNTIIEVVPAGVVALDEEGRVDFMNRTSLKTMGIKEEEGYARFFWEFFEEPEQIRTAIESAEITGKSTSLSARLKNGRYLEVAIAPLCKRQEILGFVVGFVDVTEIKRVDETRKNIISNVSHELLTPVTIIQGMLEVLLEELPQEKYREYLKTMFYSLRRLKQIVTDLVEAAKLESDRIELQKKEVSLKELIKSILSDFEQDFASKKLKVNVDVQDIVIKGDWEKLKLVFRNIIDNAVKFNRSGGSIDVTVEKLENMVKICVKDTGVRIPEDKLQHIFKPLYQVDSSATRRFSGTGTGLYVVKKIVEAHGGKIWVESTSPQGTTVCFTLPVE